MLIATPEPTAPQRVLAEVKSTDLVDLAGALIRIPSFKTEETPVARCAGGGGVREGESAENDCSVNQAIYPVYARNLWLSVGSV
jgi:hypothetical protein